MKDLKDLKDLKNLKDLKDFQESFPQRLGRVAAVSHSTVRARADFPVFIGEAVRLGARALWGEVVRVEGENVAIRIYEEPLGLAAGDPAFFRGTCDALEGENLEAGVYDALGRPLRVDGALRSAPCAGGVHPFFSGVRVLDVLYPAAYGDYVLLSGASGTGKTVLLRALANHGAADAVVCVFCAARGSDIASFREDLSPPGAARTVLFAHGADEPPAGAAKAVLNGLSAGATLRDQGKNVLLLVDGLAFCEESGALALRVAAGCAKGSGSLTAVVSVSESTGHEGMFGDPAVFWRLDSTSAGSGRFPSVCPASFSTSRHREDAGPLRDYLAATLRRRADLAAREEGRPFSAEETGFLFYAELLDGLFLRQNLYGNEAHYSFPRSLALLRVLKKLEEHLGHALDGGRTWDDLRALPLRTALLELRAAEASAIAARGEECLASLFALPNGETAADGRQGGDHQGKEARRDAAL